MKLTQDRRKKNLHVPNGSANGKVYLPDIEAYQNRFMVLHSEICSWRKVAEPYGEGLKPNMARMIANGYDPGNKIRSVLRLPNKEAVQVCDECGEIHVKGHPKKRSRPPRIAISLTDPKSAATTILEHMEPNNISMLINLLNERRGNEHENDPGDRVQTSQG